jgi:hypothetical protein
MDLTKIEKPFGLLDKETQDALRAHGGPIQWVSGCGWRNIISPSWLSNYTYRAAPQPVRGEVVVFGQAGGDYWWRRGSDDGVYHYRIAATTLDDNLIPGVYTGPDGATIVVAVL